MSAGKIFAILIGAFLLLTSIGLIIGGSALLTINEAVVDEDGYLTSSEITLSTMDDRSVAIVVDSIQIEAESSSYKSSFKSGPGSFVQFRLQLPDNDGSYFAGIADADAVRDYLSEVPYQRISRISSLDDEHHHMSRDKFDSFDFHDDDDFDFSFSAVLEIEFQTVHAGANQSLEQNQPGDQDFWLASTTGTELEWAPEYGEFALVVMKADGSPNIETQVAVGVRIPILTPIGGFLVVIGVAVLLSSLVLFYVGLRSSCSLKPTGPQSQVYYVPTKSSDPKKINENESNFVLKDEIKDKSSTSTDTLGIESKYCTQCGDTIESDTRFCSECGHKVA